MNAPYRHVVVSGNCAAQMSALVERLRDLGVEVTLASGPEALPNQPVTTVILAEALSADLSWQEWWSQDGDNRAVFEDTLSRLTDTSSGILLGFARTDASRDRARIRAGMRSLVKRFHAHAAADRAIDFSMNGLEVPLTFDSALLVDRVVDHVLRRKLLAVETVVSLTDVTDMTIGEALTNSFI